MLRVLRDVAALVRVTVVEKIETNFSTLNIKFFSAPAEKADKFNTKAADFSLHAEQLCRVAEVTSTAFEF